MKIDSYNKIPVSEITDWHTNPASLIISHFDGTTNNAMSKRSESPHRINYYQLLLLEEGNGFYQIDGDSFYFTSPGILPIAHGRVVKFDFIPQSKGCTLVFPQEYLYKRHEDLEWINKLVIFNPATDSSPVELDHIEYRNFINDLIKIKDELKKEICSERDEIIQHLVRVFLLSVERIKKTQLNRDDNNPIQTNYLTRFKQKLEENYSTNRSVLFYAESLSVTPRKLNQVILRDTGKSVKQIIEERVVLEIKRLLTYTDYTVKEIGYLLGFNDPTNFNKFFKKCFQITPSDYRQTSCSTYFNHKMVNSNHL